MLKKSLVILAVSAKAAVLALALGVSMAGVDADDAQLCCLPPPCPPEGCDEGEEES